MMKRSIYVGLVLLFIVMLSGCDMLPSRPGEGTQEEGPAPELDILPMISVTGKVVPEVWGMVGSQTGGMVRDVMVEAGDVINAGDVLLRFDDTDAHLAVQQAEAAVAAAEAQVVQLRAKPREVDIAVVEAQIAAANTVISQTQTQYNQLWSGSHEANVAAAEAQIAALLAEQLVARQQHDDTMKCQEITLPDGSSKEVCPALGTYEERARFALNAVNQSLIAAEAQLDALQKGFWGQVNNAKAGIAVAESQRDVAAAQLNVLLAGTPSEAVAVAEAAVAQALVGLDAARVALSRSVVTAPFAGTVGQVSVRQGEFVAPGQPLLTVGDLATLRVETTDLNEVDVGRIREGQQVVLTYDAFPEEVFSGKITRIAPMAQPGGGGVNYTVIIEMEGMPEGVRWGMTAFVDIQVEQ
ncbi:MAG: HlyD family efflux transporter periplasmic adaptor subunit [Anaerolineae bacterium]|nr:HlyD family efflux transporter periplasmic adaptor subunit [Anaerolineae bacterium]